MWEWGEVGKKTYKFFDGKKMGKEGEEEGRRVVLLAADGGWLNEWQVKGAGGWKAEEEAESCRTKYAKGQQQLIGQRQQKSQMGGGKADGQEC
jgi:hypothetical protein